MLMPVGVSPFASLTKACMKRLEDNGRTLHGIPPEELQPALTSASDLVGLCTKHREVLGIHPSVGIIHTTVPDADVGKDS